mmetsp:Transcript_667/g.1063  ORF Transcript_667/g.1063 Transcript_667/m.1063 type:complete len:440 (-) Transcript_667:43-1362(-)
MSDSSSGSSVASDDDSVTEDIFLDDLQLLRGNDSSVTDLKVSGWFPYVQDMTGEDWEQLGRDISNNRHLNKITFVAALDDHTMTSLFRGLTISSSIDEMTFTNNRCGVNGIRSMVPFLQNANNLLELDFFHDNISSEGFSLVWRALRDSPINILTFHCCGLSSIKIDDDYVPNLQSLMLSGNNINADGCRAVAKLLRMEHTKLEHLFLNENKIDDEGTSILANALQTNTSLGLMNLQNNEGITIEGMKRVLKLLNDISSIKATLQSNHTLFSMTFNDSFENTDIATEIRRVLQINGDNLDNPDMTGKLKVIHTQLDSKQRAEMCRLQGVQNSGKPLTEFGPLLLPEVLEIVGKHHGLSECYESFRTCVADLWTIIDRKEVLRQQKAELAIELDALVAKRREVETQMSNIEMEIDLMEQAELSQHAACDGSHKSKRQKMS